MHRNYPCVFVYLPVVKAVPMRRNRQILFFEMVSQMFLVHLSLVLLGITSSHHLHLE